MRNAINERRDGMNDDLHKSGVGGRNIIFRKDAGSLHQFSTGRRV